jgi:hypothetical protein
VLAWVSGSSNHKSLLEKDQNVGEKISIPETVLVREMQGESVLLDLSTETYYGLDDVGSRMWAAIASEGTIAGACALLLSEYDVMAAQLESDLREFIGKLVEVGLLSMRDE